MYTQHYSDRLYREQVITSIGGYGKLLGSCVVDKGHQNGEEIHFLTDNAIIVIYNRKTLRRITTLIARPRQMTRYGFNIPQYVLDRAEQHKLVGLNN